MDYMMNGELDKCALNFSSYANFDLVASDQ